MLTAQVRAMQASDPKKVAIKLRQGDGARWHRIWDGNPRIAKPDEVSRGTPVQWLNNCSGNRPYMDYSKEVPKVRYAFMPYGPEPGEIYLREEERKKFRHLEGMVLIEPNTKQGTTPNKQWGWERWQEVVHLRKDLKFVQIGQFGTRALRDVQLVYTLDERQAAAAVSLVRAVVVPEGGLHHAAAGFGIPGVVLFGGYIAPSVTGYSMHRNIFTGGDEHPNGCGMRIRCEHCQKALAEITPDRVAAELDQVLS